MLNYSSSTLMTKRGASGHISNSLCSNVNKSIFREGEMIYAIDENYCNTEMCMCYNPQFCHKADNVSFVGEEDIIVYKQSTK